MIANVDLTHVLVLEIFEVLFLLQTRVKTMKAIVQKKNEMCQQSEQWQSHEFTETTAPFVF